MQYNTVCLEAEDRIFIQVTTIDCLAIKRCLLLNMVRFIARYYSSFVTVYLSNDK